MIDRILTTLFYVPTVPDWRPGEATPLAGFSRQLCETSPHLRALTQLPTTILDFVPQYHAGFFARRLCGTAPLEVHPQSPRAIRSMPVPDETPFTILILSPEERVADYAGWASSCPIRPILVSSGGEDLAYSDSGTTDAEPIPISVSRVFQRYRNTHLRLPVAETTRYSPPPSP